jgi:hypothetical protein
MLAISFSLNFVHRLAGQPACLQSMAAKENFKGMKKGGCEPPFFMCNEECYW